MRGRLPRSRQATALQNELVEIGPVIKFHQRVLFQCRRRDAWS